MRKITILRLCHRIGRDTRISTHVALSARALGASNVIFSGEKDDSVIESVNKLCENWGGEPRFNATYQANWKKVMKEFNGVKVHLTMYGLPIQKEIAQIRKRAATQDVLVAVGAARVPMEAYSLSDYNIAVTSQPHSEVAALAVFLHELWEGKELELQFPNPKIEISPNARGKTVKNPRALAKI